MTKPNQVTDDDESHLFHTIFIDTSLDTHLVTIVPLSDTVSDFKQKIQYEHVRCFPNIGEISVNALKVKRRGLLYHLSDIMLVKCAFDGFTKSWLISADVSTPEKQEKVRNFPTFESVKLIATSNPGNKHLLPPRSERPCGVGLLLPEDESNQSIEQNEYVGERSSLIIANSLHVDNMKTGSGHGKSPIITEYNEVQRKKTEDWGQNLQNEVSDVLLGSISEKEPLTGLHEKEVFKRGKNNDGDNRKDNEVQRMKSEGREDNLHDDVTDAQQGTQATVSHESKVHKKKNRCYDVNMQENEMQKMEIEAKEHNLLMVTDVQGDVAGSGTQVTAPHEERMHQKKERSKPTSQKRCGNENSGVDEAALVETGTLVHCSKKGNQKPIDTKTVSQHDVMDKLGDSDPALDGLPTETSERASLLPENVDHLQSTRKTGREKRKKKKKSSIRSSQEIAASPLCTEDSGCKKNHDYKEKIESDQLDKIDEEKELACNLTSKNTTSKSYKLPAQEDTEMSNKEDSDTSKLLDVDTVNGGKSSRRRHKRNKNSVSEALVVSDLVEGYMGGNSMSDCNKAPEEDNCNTERYKKKSRVMPGKEQKGVSDIDAISASFLATDREIDQVIKNVVESVQKARENDTANMDKKRRKESKKKKLRDSNEKSVLGLQTENRVDDHKIPEAAMEISMDTAEMTDRTNLDYTISLPELKGSSVGHVEKTSGDNDHPGTLSSVLIESLQVLPNEENSKKRCVEAVVDTTFSNGAHGEEVDSSIKVSCENDRIDFSKYFIQSGCDNETAADMLVGDVAKERQVGSQLKSNKTKAAGQYNVLSSSMRWSEDLGSKEIRHTSDSNTLVSKGRNKPLKAFRPDLKAPPSDKRERNVFRVSRRCQKVDVAPGSSLESTKNIEFQNKRSDGSKSHEEKRLRDGEKPSASIGGETSKRLKHDNSVLGLSGGFFKDFMSSADDNSLEYPDDSGRTPSDNSLSSVFSDGESNSDVSSQKGSSSFRRKESNAKFTKESFSPTVPLHTILRSSRRYKTAKLVASQLLPEDESEPVEFVPESQA